MEVETYYFAVTLSQEKDPVVHAGSTTFGKRTLLRVFRALALSEDEAYGMVWRQCQKEHPGYVVDGLTHMKHEEPAGASV